MECNNKEVFRDLLFSVKNRKFKIQYLYDFLETTDFFTAPASTKYHGAYEGGLLEHSLAVYHNLKRLHEIYSTEPAVLAISEESMIIAGLLHDVCKISFYKSDTKNVKDKVTGKWHEESYYSIDDHIPLGHGEKSVIILQQHIHLITDEIYAIRWHMGGFDDTAKSWSGSQALSASMSKCPLLVLLHMADLAANYISKV